MDDKTSKAFDFAQESVKQLITLATGVIALGITFAKDFVSAVPAGARSLALWSWGAFLLSVLFGLWALLALTGTLDAEASVPVSIRGTNVKIPATLQILFFVIGLSLTVWFGIVATRHGA
jgi:hypothetical protein